MTNRKWKMENLSAFCLLPSASAFRLLPLYFPSFLLLALPLSGCRRGGEPGTLVIAIELPTRGFDPRFSTGIQTSARIMQLIYDTLVARNEKFEFVPSLRKLRRIRGSQDLYFSSAFGRHFHNGKPLTSADVKYTFDSLLSRI